MTSEPRPARRLRAARLLAAGAAAGVLLTLGGCGGDPASGSGLDAGSDPGADAATQAADPSPTDDAGGSAGDPCGLLDPDAVAKILQDANPDEGAVTVTAEPSGVDVGGTCTYSWSGAVTFSKTFSVSLVDADLLDATAPESGRTPLPGIGDEAFESSGNYYARVGDRAVHLVNLQESEDAAKAVLAAAAANL